jgi:hypothetical protein
MTNILLRLSDVEIKNKDHRRKGQICLEFIGGFGEGT